VKVRFAWASRPLLVFDWFGHDSRGDSLGVAIGPVST
jgi:hypothetical protein